MGQQQVEAVLAVWWHGPHGHHGEFSARCLSVTLGVFVSLLNFHLHPSPENGSYLPFVMLWQKQLIWTT